MIAHLKDCSGARLQGFAICGVGSGAAGLSLTLALARLGIGVLRFHLGDWKEAADLEADVGAAEPPHPGIADCRRQRFGGITHLWGGSRCVPLNGANCAHRSHVPLSRWPIGEIDPPQYLAATMEVRIVGAADFAIVSLAGPTAPMFAAIPRLALAWSERIERYSLPTDFAPECREELKRRPYALVNLRARCSGMDVVRGGEGVPPAKWGIMAPIGWAPWCESVAVPRLFRCTRRDTRMAALRHSAQPRLRFTANASSALGLSRALRRVSI